LTLSAARALGRVAHKSVVTAAVFSPNGRIVATASADGTATLIDVATGEFLCKPLKHDGWCSQSLSIRVERFLMTACDDGVARLWEVRAAVCWAGNSATISRLCRRLQP